MNDGLSFLPTGLSKFEWHWLHSAGVALPIVGSWSWHPRVDLIGRLFETTPQVGFLHIVVGAGFAILYVAGVEGRVGVGCKWLRILSEVIIGST